MEEQIAHLRAELLHREQEHDRVQLQLVKEKEERERAERQVSQLQLQNLSLVDGPSSLLQLAGMAVCRCIACKQFFKMSELLQTSSCCKSGKQHAC